VQLTVFPFYHFFKTHLSDDLFSAPHLLRSNHSLQKGGEGGGRARERELMLRQSQVPWECVAQVQCKQRQSSVLNSQRIVNAGEGRALFVLCLASLRLQLDECGWFDCTRKMSPEVGGSVLRRSVPKTFCLAFF